MTESSIPTTGTPTPLDEEFAAESSPFEMGRPRESRSTLLPELPWVLLAEPPKESLDSRETSSSSPEEELLEPHASKPKANIKKTTAQNRRFIRRSNISRNIKRNGIFINGLEHFARI
jgi:hypothetical protein